MISKFDQSESADETRWQEGFLQLLPMLKRYACFAFRQMNPVAQEDAVSDVVVNAMVAYRRLHERGQLQRAFASVLVRYAVAQYRRGQRVGTPQRTNDVFSPVAKSKGDFELASIGSPSAQSGTWMECLADNRRSTIPNQVAFRIDFPRWLKGLPDRDRMVAEQLALGHSTSDVANTFDLTRGRISQLRRELALSWYAFGG